MRNENGDFITEEIDINSFIEEIKKYGVRVDAIKVIGVEVEFLFECTRLRESLKIITGKNVSKNSY